MSSIDKNSHKIDLKLSTLKIDIAKWARIALGPEDQLEVKYYHMCM